MTKPSIFNIFQEDNGVFSYARVIGSILCLVGLFFLKQAIDEDSRLAFESGLFLIGIGYGGKIIQKPFEKKQ